MAFEDPFEGSLIRPHLLTVAGAAQALRKVSFEVFLTWFPFNFGQNGLSTSNVAAFYQNPHSRLKIVDVFLCLRELSNGIGDYKRIEMRLLEITFEIFR